MKLKPLHFFNAISVIALATVFVFFLSWHFRLGQIRYFDADEFAHLHWASQFVRGTPPYTGFFYFFPPGFLFFLAPLFVFGEGITPLVTGRILMFVTFTITCFASGFLYFRMRRSVIGAVLAMVLLSFIPMPFDKFLEIRPDNPATMLAVLGMVYQVLYFQSGRTVHAAISGFCYAVSLIILPKMVPGIGIAVLLFFVHKVSGLVTLLKQPSGTWQSLIRTGAGWFAIGALIPVCVVGLYVLTLGNLSTVLYSLTKLPVEANKISGIFIMMPDLFFYPNQTFYGMHGWNVGLLTNHTIWVLGVVMGILRLVTPVLPDGKRGIGAELLVGGMFFANAIAYVAYVPLKHTQYLIPVAVFVAWYAADALDTLRIRLSRHPSGLVVGTGVVIILSYFLYHTFSAVNSPKFSWTNRETLDELDWLFRTIPRSEYILDLDGRTMYYPDPYFACCIPFGQSQQFLSQPLPSLSDALEKTKAKYIYQGQLERISTLPQEERAYIGRHYEPFQGRNEIWVRK